MKNIIKYLAGSILALALFLVLGSLVSPSLRAALSPVYGSNGVVTFSPNTNFTLVAGAATVADTSVAAGCEVVVSLQTPGGTIAAQPYVATQTNGTGFTVAGGGASNTSVMTYYIKYQ